MDLLYRLILYLMIYNKWSEMLEQEEKILNFTQDRHEKLPAANSKYK